MTKSFEHHARTVSVLTFVSRVTGFARESIFSRVFGLGPIMDAFSFAFMLPNLSRRLFGEGALSSAFLPRFTKLDQDDPASAQRFGAMMLAATGAILFGLLLVVECVLFVLWWNAPSVVVELHAPLHMSGVLMPTIAVQPAALGYELAMLMMPYMPLVCVVALGSAVLQSKGRFFVAAAVPILLNLSFIVVSLAAIPFLGEESGRRTHIILVGCSVLLAGVLQAAWTLSELRKVGLVFEFRDAIARLHVKQTMLQSFPVILGMGALQINTFLGGLIASWPSFIGPTVFGIEYPLQQGAMGALSSAQRLSEFPLAIFGLSIATAIFPKLARESSDLKMFAATLQLGMRRAFFVGLPASVGLYFVAEPACGVAFQGNAFTHEDTLRVAAILRGFTFAIWSYSMVHILLRAFYALDDRRTPLRVSLCMVGLNLLLNVTLIFTPLREAGLAYSTAFCSIVQCVWILWLIERRVPGVVDAALRKAFLKPMIATAVMAVVLAALITVLPAATTWSAQGMQLLVMIPVGAGVFFVAAKLLRTPELTRG